MNEKGRGRKARFSRSRQAGRSEMLEVREGQQARAAELAGWCRMRRLNCR